MSIFKKIERFFLMRTWRGKEILMHRLIEEGVTEEDKRRKREGIERVQQLRKELQNENP
ncbi:MAG: hypothetical protein IJX18_02940 [Clostridia bacterium]|nr:hypothetical protein [Clostridia bacterium]